MAQTLCFIIQVHHQQQKKLHSNLGDEHAKLTFLNQTQGTHAPFV